MLITYIAIINEYIFKAPFKETFHFYFFIVFWLMLINEKKEFNLLLTV